MLTSQLNVTYEGVKNLIPCQRNARTHSKQQIRLIADSIRAFGFTNPILVNRSRMIIAGRYIQASKFGTDVLGNSSPRPKGSSLAQLRCSANRTSTIAPTRKPRGMPSSRSLASIYRPSSPIRRRVRR
jgi:ParB-like nuclease domain